MEKTTTIKIKEIAQKIFFEEVAPNLDTPIFEAKDKECVIKGIEKGLILAINQGRKW